jgi:sulfoxide reductase heme-binding subunit YedZ
MPALWRDRSGKLSGLRIATLLVLVTPGILAALVLLASTSAPPAVMTADAARPITDAIHTVGDWAVRFLLLGLAVSPAMRVFRQPRLVGVRRMIGVGAFAYAATHLCLYVIDQKFDLARVATEIVLRFYLTIGFVALLGLAALAATSTDAMVRRLGPAWQRLHRLVYPITALALLHYFIQSKIDVTQPVLMTGFFVWLMGFRLLARRAVPGPAGLAGLAVAASLLTALIEAGWYGVATGAMPLRVLAANLDVSLGLRPAAWVLLAGLAVALASLLHRLRTPSGTGRGRAARATASPPA